MSSAQDIDLAALGDALGESSYRSESSNDASTLRKSGSDLEAKKAKEPTDEGTKDTSIKEYDKQIQVSEAVKDDKASPSQKPEKEFPKAETTSTEPTTEPNKANTTTSPTGSKDANSKETATSNTATFTSEAPTTASSGAKSSRTSTPAREAEEDRVSEAKPSKQASPPVPKDHPSDPPPALPKNHPAQASASTGAQATPDDPVAFLHSMFPDLPKETVQDVLSAVGNPDRAVQVLLSFSSNDLKSPPALPGHHPTTSAIPAGSMPSPAPVGAPTSVHDPTANDEALARALMMEEQQAAQSRRAHPAPRQPAPTTYDSSRLAYQPRVRKPPGSRAPPPPLPRNHPRTVYDSNAPLTKPSRSPGTAGYQYGQAPPSQGGKGAHPVQGQQGQNGPDWSEELDKFADNASRVAEAGFSRAASTFSAFKARAQALVEQGKEPNSSGGAGGGGGGIGGWLPRREGASNRNGNGPAPSGESPPKPKPISVLSRPTTTRKFSDSSDADAHPVGEGDLAALSRASNPGTPPQAPAPSKSPGMKEDPRAALARLAESSHSSQMQNFGVDKGSAADPTVPKQGANATDKALPQPSGPASDQSKPGTELTGLATAGGLGAGLVGGAVLAGLDDDDDDKDDDDNSDDLEYVANPFEDED